MSVKPAQVRYLESGKSLGAAVHKGWAATWNWVLSFVVGFTGGKGCKLENADKGHPRLDVLIEAGPGCSVTGGEDGQPYVISCDGGGGGGGGGDDPDDPSQDEQSQGVTGTREVCVGAVYDSTAHTLCRQYVVITITKGLITDWPESPSVDSTPIFEAEAHSAEVS